MKKVLVAIVILFLIGVAVVFGFFINRYFQPQYYAVYMRTGDIYFGKFKPLSRHTLTDVWFLQQTNNQQNPLSIQKFENVFWKPKGDLILNEDEIVWKAPIRDDSEIAKIIQQGVAPQTQTQTLQAAPAPTSTRPTQ